jgi:hypothetical protein
MHLRVQSREGVLMSERRATNIVLRQGAAIIARLFSGAAGSQPINQIQVGFAKEAATTELTALTPSEANLPLAALRSPVSAGDFRVVTDRAGFIQVAISAVFRPTIDLQDVTEAGLLAGEQLYNQVVFEPVTLRVGQDVTFFWEVDFPFGH